MGDVITSSHLSLVQGSYGSWKTWKVLDFMAFSRTGRSWKKATGPGKRPLVLERSGNVFNSAKRGEMYGRPYGELTLGSWEYRG